ncbi:MAG: serine/threonine protein kinase [Proteobacteria bacterium]|nr:serine/threonine protein kinase [Pseudomonadota bacterium]
MHDPANANASGSDAPHRGGEPFDVPSIPGYRIRNRLGRGGMASVYLATQESLDRPVGIKVMDGDVLADEVARQRFENEARTIAHLSHPHIVAIHEVGRAGDGRPYYVMPYLGSGDLTQRDFAADEAKVAQVLRALLSALGYAHARGIVHRDVKRENVLFDADDRPMLTDFGIATMHKRDVRLTTVGLAVGSSNYMSPEQARGEAVDGRADLYSVGVLAFELLAGHPPFRADDALALALMHAQDAVPALPPERRHWQAFIERAMAKSRDARFVNAQDMLQALEHVVQRHGSLTGQVLQAVQGAHAGRGKKPLALGAAALLVLGGAWYLHARDGKPAAAAATPAAGEPASAASRVAANPEGAASLVDAGAAAQAAASPAGAQPASDASASARNPSAASPNGDASPASPSAGQASSAASKDKKPARHARPRRKPPKRNFIQRFFHNL